MIHRWRDRFAGLEDGERTALHGLVLLLLWALAQHVLLSPWLIEDAAISMTYARHLATGEGFVANPGAEPVEGFSNPSWTLALALLTAVRVDPFTGAKLLGAACAVVATLATWQAARRLVPGSAAPLLAPLLLVTNAQFTIWNAAGLENPLYVALLVVGTLMWLREWEHPGATPWSGLVLGLLAVTRPEGAAFALAPLAGTLLATNWRGWVARASTIAAWLVVAVAPALLWQAVRMRVFAWPAPNTYYAKLSAIDRSLPLDWDARSWTYVVAWLLTSGVVVSLPALVAAPHRGGKRLLAVGLALLAGAAAVTGHSDVEAWWWTGNEPDTVEIGRIALIGLAAAVPVVLALRQRASVDRTVWSLHALGAVAFAVYAGGDWMVGYRWMSTLAAPLALLTADAAATLWREPGRRALRRLVSGLAVAAPLVAGVGYQVWFLSHVDTTPFDIERRVAYLERTIERADLDFPTVLDIDMGGNIWWGDYTTLDFAGLLDVPVAHHSWERAFVEEYGYRERNPELVHLHGPWASRTRFDRLAGFSSRYIVLPPFTAGRSNLHIGSFLRRDTLLGQIPEEDGPQTVQFGDHLRLMWRVDADEVAPGQRLVVSGSLQTTRTRHPKFRLWTFLAADGALVVHDVAPAFDWVPVSSWRPQEAWRFRVPVPVPDDFPIGPTTLGFVAVDEATGEVLLAGDRRTGPAGFRMAFGEALWPGAVGVVDPEIAVAHARVREDLALARADATSCELAEDGLDALRQLRAERDQPALESAIARCWARRADASTGAEAANAIERARHYDHRDPEVLRVGERLADTWTDVGTAAATRSAWDEVHQAWRWALLADPTRAALRRRLEQVRDTRLGIRR